MSHSVIPITRRSWRSLKAQNDYLVEIGPETSARFTGPSAQEYAAGFAATLDKLEQYAELIGSIPAGSDPAEFHARLADSVFMELLASPAMQGGNQR